MHILFITRAFGKQAGGMERLSFELINSLKNQPNTKVSVLAYHTKPGVSLYWARLNSALFSLTVIPPAIWQAYQADIIHIGDPVLSLAGYLIKKFIGKPVAVTVHGLDVSFENPLYRWYLKTFFRRFDTYIPISRYAREKLKLWNVTGQITIIPPGVKDTYFDPALQQSEKPTAAPHQQLVQPTGGQWMDKMPRKQEPTEKFSNKRVTGRLPFRGSAPEPVESGSALAGPATEKDFSVGSDRSAIILFTAGRLIKRKGHEWFIRQVLPQLPPNVSYSIAGEGPEEQNIRQAITATNQTNRVHLLGRVSNERLQELYNTINIFIQPNILVQNDAEGFGIVLLEAALCRRHVIASDIDGIPDAIHNGENGYLVPTQNTQAWITKINEVLTEPPINPSARQYTLENFAWPKISQRYQSVFQETVKNDSGE